MCCLFFGLIKPHVYIASSEWQEAELISTAHIIKPAVVLTCQSGFISHNLIVCITSIWPFASFWIRIRSMWVSACASRKHQEHVWNTANKNTHLVPFCMPGILLPARFRLLPEPPYWLCRRAEKLCDSEQCLACSSSDRKEGLWTGLGVKLSLEVGSLNSQVRQVIASHPLQSCYIKWKPR